MYDARARTFTGVHAHQKQHIVITAVDDELADQGIDHAVIFRRADDKWGKKTLEFAVRSAFTIEGGSRIFNLGVDGRVCILNLPGVSEEHVDPSQNGPSNLLTLRASREIDGEIFAVGMGRQVYRRNAQGDWQRADQGVFLDRGQRDTAIGFHALAGLSARDIHCVGHGGEIWHFDGQQWAQQRSPTTVALNAVTCTANGEVYACGIAGVIVHGRGDSWQVLAQNLTTADFWGATTFQGQIYLANAEGLFVIRNGALHRLDMALQVSTGYLDAADGRLWSVGPKDIAFSDDGLTWARLDNP